MRPFALWITGPPASGKSTLTAALIALLAERGVRPAVLESDALRRVLTPQPRYDERERETFYGAMTWIGALLVSHGVPVIFDATAGRRAWRDAAREQIERFAEIHLDTPLVRCRARDPKGIYRTAGSDPAGQVPGVQAPYEPPLAPELVVDGERESPEAAARRIVELLAARGWLDITS